MSRATTAPNRAREYETIYILRPDIDGEAAERVGARLAEIVTRESGRLTKVEMWGRRRLAYDIRKHKRGVYVYLRYVGGGAVVSELERNLRLADGVLKYQTVLVRGDVELENMAVPDEDVQFEKLDLIPLEDERDDSRERQLGLMEPERRQERHHEPAPSVSDDEADSESTDEDEES